MKILALDTATKTGWAIVVDGKVVESGMQDFSKRRGEGNGILFLRFGVWLHEIAGLYPIDLIAYEQAHFRGGAATEIGVGLQTRVQEKAAHFEIEAVGIHTGTLKKWATGHGKAEKEKMVEAANRYSPTIITDDNQADAVLLGMYASSQFDITGDHTVFSTE